MSYYPDDAPFTDRLRYEMWLRTTFRKELIKFANFIKNYRTMTEARTAMEELDITPRYVDQEKYDRDMAYYYLLTDWYMSYDEMFWALLEPGEQESKDTEHVLMQLAFAYTLLCEDEEIFDEALLSDMNWRASLTFAKK